MGSDGNWIGGHPTPGLREHRRRPRAGRRSRLSPCVRERLRGYPELVAFAARDRARSSERRARRLLRRAAVRPGEARAVLERVRRLPRGALPHAPRALMHGPPPAERPTCAGSTARSPPTAPARSSRRPAPGSSGAGAPTAWSSTAPLLRVAARRRGCAASPRPRARGSATAPAPSLRLAVPRQEPQPQPAVVRDEGLRQRRKVRRFRARHSRRAAARPAVLQAASSRRSSGSPASSASLAGGGEARDARRPHPARLADGGRDHEVGARQLRARAAAHEGEPGAQRDRHEGVGRRPLRPALQSTASTMPSSPAISRARRTGTTSVTPPSTRRRPFQTKGGKTPGKLQEARTASRRLPSRNTTGARRCRRRWRARPPARAGASKVGVGQELVDERARAACPRGARRPSRAPTSRGGAARPGPRGCRGRRRPAQAAATSAPPLTPGDARHREPARARAPGARRRAPRRARRPRRARGRASSRRRGYGRRAKANSFRRSERGSGRGERPDEDPAWISWSERTSVARSRSARIACTVAAAAVSVVTHEHAVERGALADGAVVVERLLAERGVEDDVDPCRLLIWSTTLGRPSLTL